MLQAAEFFRRVFGDPRHQYIVAGQYTLIVALATSFYVAVILNQPNHPVGLFPQRARDGLTALTVVMACLSAATGVCIMSTWIGYPRLFTGLLVLLMVFTMALVPCLFDVTYAHMGRWDGPMESRMVDKIMAQTTQRWLNLTTLPDDGSVGDAAVSVGPGVGSLRLFLSTADPFLFTVPSPTLRCPLYSFKDFECRQKDGRLSDCVNATSGVIQIRTEDTCCGYHAPCPLEQCFTLVNENTSIVPWPSPQKGDALPPAPLSCRQFLTNELTKFTTRVISLVALVLVGVGLMAALSVRARQTLQPIYVVPDWAT